MRFQRLYIDVTYTRTQRGTVGITRTVRRLAEEMDLLLPSEGIHFQRAAYHALGFRSLTGQINATTPREGGGSCLLGLATGTLKPVIEQALRLPWAVIRGPWQIASARAFNALSQSQPPIPFGQGDVLLMCDVSWNYPAWPAAQRARAEGAKVVTVVYDLMPLRFPGFVVPWVRAAYFHWLKAMLQSSDAVICISKATQDDLCSFAAVQQWRLPPVGHFRLGCDLSPATDYVARKSMSAFVSGPQPCFAAVGTLEPKKNYGFLLSTFESLWAAGKQAKLVIAGRRTSESVGWEARMRHLEKQGLLLLVDDATDSEIAFIYRQCRALVIPSLAEGFGLPLVEARSQGCPVIASDIPSFAELADGGVDLYDRHSQRALEELITRHADKDRRSCAGRMAAFSWHDSAHQALEVMDRLLQDTSVTQ